MTGKEISNLNINEKEIDNDTYFKLIRPITDIHKIVYDGNPNNKYHYYIETYDNYSFRFNVKRKVLK